MSGYEARFAARKDELEWLYKELYGDNRWYLDQLENTLAGYARERPLDLRHLDDAREAHPGWYLTENSLEVKVHVRRFAGDLATMQEKIPYLKEVGATSLRWRSRSETMGGWWRILTNWILSWEQRPISSACARNFWPSRWTSGWNCR
jgi:hypothetical protein